MRTFVSRHSHPIGQATAEYVAGSLDGARTHAEKLSSQGGPYVVWHYGCSACNGVGLILSP